MVKIKFPDGSSKEFEQGVTVKEIAHSIGAGLAKAALAGKVNGTLVDLDTTITTDATLEIVTFNSTEGRDIFWHSASHLMTHAVLRLYGNKIGLGVGMPVDDGFYQDYDLDELTPEDLEKIEAEMEKIVHEKLEITHKVISKKEALEFYKDDPYKTELVNAVPGDTVTMYFQGEFENLCKGPHVPNTSYLKAFKLTRIAKAYWRGNVKNKQLTRIYGVCFPSKKELKDHLDKLEEALKRDHTKLGKQLDLYINAELVGKGLPLLTPKGATLRRVLYRFIQDEEIRRGYLFTETPVLAKTDLYKVSGHLKHYREHMFILTHEDSEIALRPMTCPHQYMIYKRKPHSYRELPVRLAEISSLFRKEQSGELHGLIRIFQFSLADAHIICMPDQVEDEFKGVVDLIQYVMRCLGLTDYWYRFSKWDPNDKKKYVDKPKAWEKAQVQMKKILDDLKLDYVEAEGEAAFYGPKLDIQMRNVFGKEDTFFTVQIDFVAAENFNMTYIDENNDEKPPIVIHRSSIGCLERTMAALIEHYAGKFPLWMNPEQIRILPVADRFAPDAEKLKWKLFDAGFRAEVDDRTETINKKVREAQLDFVNYILVFGEKEIESGKLFVRTRDNELIKDVAVDEFIKRLKKEVAEFK